MSHSVVRPVGQSDLSNPAFKSQMNLNLGKIKSYAELDLEKIEEFKLKVQDLLESAGEEKKSSFSKILKALESTESQILALKVILHEYQSHEECALVDLLSFSNDLQSKLEVHGCKDLFKPGEGMKLLYSQVVPGFVVEEKETKKKLHNDELAINGTKEEDAEDCEDDEEFIGQAVAPRSNAVKALKPHMGNIVKVIMGLALFFFLVPRR